MRKCLADGLQFIIHQKIEDIVEREGKRPRGQKVINQRNNNWTKHWFVNYKNNKRKALSSWMKWILSNKTKKIEELERINQRNKSSTKHSWFQEDKTVERILKVTKKSGNRERDVGCCLYESANRKLVDYKINEFLKFLW